MQVRTVVPRALAEFEETARHLAYISRRINGRSATCAALTRWSLFVTSARRLGSSALSGLSFVVLVFAVGAELALARLKGNAESAF